MKKVFFSLVFFVCVSESTFSQTPVPKPGPEGFAQAKAQFEKGEFSGALDLLKKINEKHPDHQPTLVYLGKAYYRLDRIKDSYDYFSKTKLDTLDFPTSYEYGLSFFWMRKYSGALDAFRRIPQKNALFDLASYFGAISALKLGHYNDAETMMERAVVLPAKLARSRKQYLKHIRRVKAMSEKQALALERKKMEKAQHDKLQALNPGSDPKVAPEVHGGFQEVFKRAEPKIDYIHQNQEFHGFGDKQAETLLKIFAFDAAHIFLIPPKDGSRKTGLALELELIAEEMTVRGSPVRRRVRDPDSDVVRIQTSDPTKTDLRWGSAKARSFVELPLLTYYWAGLGGDVYRKFPDFKSANRSGTHTGFVSLGGKFSWISAVAQYQYLELVNVDNEVQQNEQTSNLILEYSAFSVINFKNEFSHKVFAYEVEALDGPTSSSFGSVDISAALPIGFTPGIFLSATHISQSLYHNKDTFTTISADGQALAAKVYLKFKPVKWFKILISEDVEKYYWSNIEPEEAEDLVFRRTEIDFLEEFRAYAALDLMF